MSSYSTYITLNQQDKCFISQIFHTTMNIKHGKGRTHISILHFQTNLTSAIHCQQMLCMKKAIEPD